ETVAAIPIHVALHQGSELELALSRVERTVGFRDPDDPQGFTRADTQANSDGIRAALHQTLGRHRIVAGGEWRRDEVTDGSSLGPNLDRRLLATRSLFAQDTLALGDHFGVLAGLRWDAADPWGRELSPRATLSWQGPAVRAWLSYGRAFRAPSLGELYYPYSGNPSLRPERARSSEVGVAIPIGRDASRLELVAFSNRISDLIDFDFAAYRYGNIARAAQDGLEAWWTQAIARERRLRLALTWLNARDGAGRPLLRRARWTGSATLDSPLLGSASGELSLIWVGPRVDVDPVTFSRVPQGGFVTADVALRAPLTSWLTARVRAENLAGRAYQEVRGYPAPGRRVMLGLESVLH
ncbi:MAG: TonB-dependent receptor plug domain-containing protein, partial [Acidobacteriota bacterium]